MVLQLWMLTGLMLLIILFIGYYTASPWADDWIFLGRSEAFADAMA